MDILVCIGSSCHVRGSYSIMNELKSMITEKHLDSEVYVKPAFCLGYCKLGVTIKVDEQLVTGVTKENLTEVFDKYVLKKVD
ncbi:(2Fe-2S) ferredoxin domain-containing protein [Clostridium tagluense]|uniref:(2Fe-2S) ferredoxin domain-containing protein n=1 Tax=Clostridium tagluense TaxID=360422 RepID=UPI001C0B664F|nr:(2Fe-2S) ferredoxin domain-containing protein [Clostridium tagluense]MBU3129888.1 (2Fe-2S) ferredoxin domain-containing protein [Clostridium tagluense]MCB2298560.1 (2Fe-2S) ferredoxin domain-containing protein [Clostridium tagluense]